MPVVLRPLRKPDLLYAGLALLFLVSATYRVLDIAERVGELRHGREYVREPFDIDLPEYTLQGVEEEAARAGLKRGDRIVSINGRQMHYSGTDLWVTMAYVIVVHRAMDVGVVVRQGLQYLFARGTLRFVQVALMSVVASGAAAMTVRAGSVTTLFHGQYDASAHVLRYVNAGHNPPMVFRGCAGNTREIVRLDTGGPVIGLLPTCGYEHGSVILRAGDLLVAFTDGISEAMNADDQEWGEERLIEVVLSAQTFATPAALISHITAAADSFVGGAPQRDA